MRKLSRKGQEKDVQCACSLDSLPHCLKNLGDQYAWCYRRVSIYMSIDILILSGSFCRFIFCSSRMTVYCSIHLFTIASSLHCYILIMQCFFWCMVQVAFVAIGATMVGSITFLKNEGDYVHKGDEVCIHALPLVIHCKNFFWCACKGATLSFFIQFGYFSFGGSTVICVFEKVCSSSLTKPPPFL